MEQDIRRIFITKRKHLKLTQKELAHRLGVRSATISDFETGKTQLYSDTLEKAFEILNIVVQ